MAKLPSLDEAKKLAKAEAWRRGELFYLLHVTQRSIYTKIAKSKSRRHFLCCSRRLGKSFLLTILAFEAALRKPGARILYLAPWAKDATDIVKEASAKILPDCPSDLVPEWGSQSREFTFRNGSVIKIRGTNGETAQFLRGGSADLVVLDEIGLMDDLAHVVNDVVTPMTLTTNGSVILATTPARTPGHDSKKLCDECFADGCGFEFTLLDAPHLSDDQKAVALRSAGEKLEDIAGIIAGTDAPKTTTALREYFCKWISDAGSMIVPEFDAEAKVNIVRVVDRPPFFDAYVAMDPGMVDNTGILFGYWDVKEQRLVIERDWKETHAGTPEIAFAIKRIEKELWSDLPVFMRVCDTEKRLISDLIRSFDLPFSPADKRDSAAAVWNMRMMVKSRQIIIKPECKDLVRQLEHATWNTRGTDMARDSSSEGTDGHWDLVAALKYLCRHIVRQRNPYPAGYSDPGWGQSRAWRKQATDQSIRPDTPISRKLNKRGL